MFLFELNGTYICEPQAKLLASYHPVLCQDLLYESSSLNM